MASIDTTSAGLASGTFDARSLMFDLDPRLCDLDIERYSWTLASHSSHCSTPCHAEGKRRRINSQLLQHFHRCIMPRNTTNRSTPERTRATKKYIPVFRFDAPFTNLRFRLGKRERRRVLKDVAVVHPERILDIDRAFAFDAQTAITRDCQAIFEWLFQPLIHTLDEFLLRESSHGPVVARKQTPRRIEPKQCHGVETFFSQVRGKNAVVGKRVAINLARRFVGEPPLRRLPVTDIHLLVAFVAMKCSAERFGRRVTRRF